MPHCVTDKYQTIDKTNFDFHADKKVRQLSNNLTDMTVLILSVKKNKIVSIAFALIIVLTIISCHSNEINEVRIRSIGTYYIDLSKSKIKLSKSDSPYFNNLSFVLTEDSFKFSRVIPFESDSVGIWEMEYVDPAVCIDLKFRHSNSKWQIGPGPNYIDMPYWNTIEKYPKETGMLHFIKINKE